MTNDIRLVLQLLTPILLAIGIWILNSVSSRINTIEDTIKQFDKACEQRHSEMWGVIREGEREISRIKGRLNGRPWEE